jgi:hypothetical protein
MDPTGIAVEAAGTIWVVDVAAGTDKLGAVFRIDPSTGERSLLSDFGDPLHGPVGSNPRAIVVVPPWVPFSTVAATVELTFSPLEHADAFTVSGSFALGGGSDGVNPLTEVVSLQVGAFTTIIPAGGFSQDAAGQFLFSGVLGPAAVQVWIQPLGWARVEFRATGTEVGLSGSRIPVTVGFSIGNDRGTAILATGMSSFE